MENLLNLRQTKNFLQSNKYCFHIKTNIRTIYILVHSPFVCNFWCQYETRMPQLSATATILCDAALAIYSAFLSQSLCIQTKPNQIIQQTDANLKGLHSMLQIIIITGVLQTEAWPSPRAASTVIDLLQAATLNSNHGCVAGGQLLWCEAKCGVGGLGDASSHWEPAD